MNEGEGIIGVVCRVDKDGESKRVYIEIRGNLTVKPVNEEQDFDLEGATPTSLDQLMVVFKDLESANWVLNDGVVLASQPLTRQNGRPHFED